MELKSLRLINFQCFKDSGEISIHNMTIFIGKNDSGKTAILKAIDFFLNNKPISLDIFHKIGDKLEKKCEIELIFKVDPEKTKDIRGCKIFWCYKPKKHRYAITNLRLSAFICGFIFTNIS